MMKLNQIPLPLYAYIYVYMYIAMSPIAAVRLRAKGRN